ncbi:oxidized low-density lipoprotein receptor 1-like [Hemitrygon akajei]|uniref:oxidized low-density lipoprotein receptor 1-like n=1 Tax=Hemitrygon akajei TaxID=2704970 RepID=UPI003BF9D795
MDRSESYMNVKLGNTDSRSPFRAEPDVSYAEVNFKTLSPPRAWTDRDGLNSTYSDLNFRKEEPRIDEDEGPPIASGPGGLSTTEQTAAQEQESKVKIGNRPYRLICLLCLVTSAFIVIVAGLSIHVSQIRQSKETCHRNYNELKSTLQSKLSALNSNLSDLRHQICELLTRSRDQTCSGDWVSNKHQCYYVSTFETSFPGAKQECSNRDSRLLEINSGDEARFVSHNLRDNNLVYWTEKCENGTVGWSLLYKGSSESPVCSQCGSSNPCDGDRRFICERSAPLFPDIPEKIQGLCQQPVEST